MKSMQHLFKKLCKVNIKSCISDFGCISSSLILLFLLSRLLPSDPQITWVQDNLITVSTFVLIAYFGVIGIYTFFKNQILRTEYKIKITYKKLFLKNLALISGLILISAFLGVLLITPFFGIIFGIIAALFLITLPVLIHITQANEFSKALVTLFEKPVFVLKSTGVILFSTGALYLILTILQELYLFVVGTEVGAFAYYSYLSFFGIYILVFYLLILQIGRRYVLDNYKNL